MPQSEKELFPVKIKRYADNAWSARTDLLAREVPVTVTWNNGEGESRLWAWPFSLEYLAVGHALLEKRSLAPSACYTATVTHSGDAHRPAYQVDLYQENRPDGPPAEMAPVAASSLLRSMEHFLENAGLWQATGCFHRAGIFSPKEAAMLCVAEDIGRHNCVDRLAGWALLHGKNLSGCILFLSARLTASICCKAVRAGFRFIASHSAVTSAAVAMAEENGVTVVGFVRPREKRLNLYTDSCGKLLLP